MKRRFLDSRTIVRGCSARQDLLKAAAVIGSVMILVLENHEAHCVEIMGRFASQPNGPPVVVVTSTRNADLEWPLREMGAAAVVSDGITSDDMTDLCRRFLAEDG